MNQLIKKVDNVNLDGIVTCLPINKVGNEFFEKHFKINEKLKLNYLNSLSETL